MFQISKFSIDSNNSEGDKNNIKNGYPILGVTSCLLLNIFSTILLHILVSYDAHVHTSVDGEWLLNIFVWKLCVNNVILNTYHRKDRAWNEVSTDVGLPFSV